MPRGFPVYIFTQRQQMNKFFGDYVDITALCLVFFTTLAITIIIKRKTGKQTRALPVFILFFTPVTILTAMFFHLLENSYRAIDNVIAGNFTYSFHFYSLLLFGIVLGSIAVFLLQACWRKTVRGLRNNRTIYLYMTLVALLCLPLLPITPISNVPVFCCGLSLAGVFLARREMKLQIHYFHPVKKDKNAMA